MGRTAEQFTALAGALLLVVAAVVTVVGPAAGLAPTSDGTGQPLAVDPPVPTEFDFRPPTERDGVARVDGESFETLPAAVDAAEPGDTVRLRGRFTGDVTVDTPNLTLVSVGERRAVVDGGGEGDVLTVAAPNVTLRGLWLRNSGYRTAANDAGIWIDGRGARVVNTRVTAVTFGIWVNGVDEVVLRNNTIVGRESVRPLSKRGNGIQLWKTEGSLVVDNRVTDVRDGIYYSWAENVVARRNTMWDLRYGVHYMYSDDCRLVNNTAFDNDVGYALMVSEDLLLRGNRAINNTGRSGHGILLKSVDDSRLANNHLVGNEQGLYFYNSVNNTLRHNLVLANEVGVYVAAGSVESRVLANTFVRNGEDVQASLGRQVAWNGSARGNYWGGASVVDPDHDGVSEVAYRPAGLVEHLLDEHPAARVFVRSPAFDAVRLAQRAIPMVESPGVVDYHPLTEPPHDWQEYYA